MPDLEERTKKMMEYLEVHADDREHSAPRTVCHAPLLP